LISSTSDAISETARREALKTDHDIYSEVFIDEVNQQLLNGVLKTEGETVVLLLRQERLKSFSELWRSANLDYYNT
jgi:hypothetical protein